MGLVLMDCDFSFNFSEKISGHKDGTKIVGMFLHITGMSDLSDTYPLCGRSLVLRQQGMKLLAKA